MPSAHRSLRFAMILAALAVSAALSGVPRDVTVAFGRDDGYAARRVDQAFQGADLDRVRELVDRSLPHGVPIDPTAAARHLDPANPDLWFQRFAEVLYPRPALEGSPNAIHAHPGVSVVGPDVRNGLPVDGRESLELDILSPIVALLAILGLGGPWVARTTRARRASTIFLRGALVLGTVASVATWVQVSLAPIVLAGGVLALLVSVLRSAWPQLPRGEALALVPLAGAAAFVLFHPPALWDGRSIWLFKAKQLFFHGHLPIAELHSADLSFSHPDYPLAWPALLAAFGGMAPEWNERSALLAAPVFLAACAAALARLGRPVIGFDGVAALLLVVVLSSGPVTAGAYADAFVAMLLVAGSVAALAGRDAAWLLLGLAALTKLEGLLFAAIVIPVGVARGMRLRGAWLLLPALGHVAFARMSGLSSDFGGVDVGAAIGASGSRAVVIVSGLGDLLMHGGYNRTRGAIWIGLVSWPLALVCARWRGAHASSVGLIALAASCFFATAMMFLLSPLDLGWHVATAADRVLLTPCLLAFTALLAATRGEEGLPARAAPSA